MNLKYKNTCQERFFELEQEGSVFQKFTFFGVSSWVSLKNIIFDRSLRHLDFAKVDRSALLSGAALRIITDSVFNYVRQVCFPKPRDLYLGAGSGIFSYQGQTMDAHLPAELALTPGIPAPGLIYFLSANHVGLMHEQREFLRRHQAFIYSFVVSPLKLLLGRFFMLFYGLNRRLSAAALELSDELASVAVTVSPRDILAMHARFCAGYVLFRVLLFPLKIRRAFVVSAYSTSEICAVLRKMGVQVIEVQHGLVGPTHRGYNYAVRSHLLPTPDKVSVYTNFWKDELLTAGYYAAEQISIDKRLKYVLAEAEKTVFSFPYIVLTGQGIMANEICEFIEEFCALAKCLHLVYVPHPNESGEHIAKIMLAAGAHARAHILEKGTATTERLIIDSVAHVSVYSSCHFDAIHYKNKTYILDLLPDNLMHYYMEKDPISFISIKNGAALLALLEDAK